MEQPPPSRPSSTTEPVRRSSLLARLMNILAAPGDVFDEIKTAPSSVANWLVPIVVVTVASILGVVLIFSQPAVQQQMREAIDKGIDQQVAAGKLPPEQAKQIRERIEQVPPWVFQIFAIAFGTVSGAFSAFWWGLVVWLVAGRIFKTKIAFSKALEVSGLALTICALSIVITTLLVVVLGNIHARPAPSFLLKEFDPMSKVHMLLAALNLFYLWWTAILALGVSKLSGVSFGRAAFWLFCVWVVTRVALVGAGMGNLVL